MPKHTPSGAGHGDLHDESPSSSVVHSKASVLNTAPKNKAGESSSPKLPRPRRSPPNPVDAVEDEEGRKSPPRRRYRRDAPTIEKVQRPPSNAFITFYTAMYDDLRKENPGLPVTALAALAAKQYRKMSVSDRKAMLSRDDTDDVCFFAVEKAK